jgi:3'-phosphoadenosine 5'-phosphosulfate (PAPS) 3'-phosphatase
VADGTADIFIKDVTVRDWDLAAPKLILNEVGGDLSTVNGDQLSFEDGYERAGIIAAPSKKQCEEVAEWFWSTFHVSDNK